MEPSLSKDPNQKRIGPYLPYDLKERVYNALEARGENLSSVATELFSQWVQDVEAQEWHWTDPKSGEHNFKPAGEPYPERRRKQLPAGRPPET